MYNGLLEETHIFLWVHKYNLIYGYFISSHFLNQIFFLEIKLYSWNRIIYSW